MFVYMERFIDRVHFVSGVSRKLDNATLLHSERVRELTLQLAYYAGIKQPAQVRRLGEAAENHDVGKVGIDPAILNKPGRLTPEEKAIVDTHAIIGAELVRRAGFEEDVAFLIEHHHDYATPCRRLDLASLMYMDIYDALTKERPYKAAWRPQDAYEHIMSTSTFSLEIQPHFRRWFEHELCPTLPYFSLPYSMAN